MNIGKAIKLCRTQKDMSRAVLAKQIESSASYLSLLERNEREPSLSMLEKISHALNVPISVMVFLAADKSELAVLDEDLAEKLSYNLLKLLDVPKKHALL